MKINIFKSMAKKYKTNKVEYSRWNYFTMYISQDVIIILLVYVIIFFAFMYSSQKDNLKKIHILLGVFALFVYFFWRVKYTILPHTSESDANPIWMWSYLIIELLSISDLFQHYIFEFKGKKQKFKLEKNISNSLSNAQVDLLIPTYNEPVEILRKTLLCASEIKWKNLTINILDDGNRPEVKSLAKELDVRYFFRTTNSGAKAGNMNAALGALTGEYVAILDADFLSFRNFIEKAIPQFSDPKVGCVQFPQTFYNADPTQINSELFHKFQNEQWNWFHKILPIRDQSDLATSCGSCSVVRRASLELIGGKFPEDTITEDFDLSLRLLDVGQITRYKNETVAIGLHAKSVNDFFKQRKRWAIGNISAFRLSLLRSGKLNFLNKILIFEWRAISLPARLVTLFAPASVFLLDVWPLRANSLIEYLLFTAPMILVIANNEINSVAFSFRNLVSNHSRTVGLAISLGLEIFISFIKPQKLKFNVTAKSSTLQSQKNPYRIIIIFALLVSATSLTVGIIKYTTGANELSTDVSLLWQIWNLFLIFGALQMFSDRELKRNNERLQPNSAMNCKIFSVEKILIETGVIQDISESGLKILTMKPVLDSTVYIELPKMMIESRVIACHSISAGHWLVRVDFSKQQSAHDDLIKFIYTGDFTPEINI